MIIRLLDMVYSCYLYSLQSSSILNLRKAAKCFVQASVYIQVSLHHSSDEYGSPMPLNY